MTLFIDQLANQIRRVDPLYNQGAGALAVALEDFIAEHVADKSEAAFNAGAAYARKQIIELIEQDTPDFVHVSTGYLVGLSPEDAKSRGYYADREDAVACATRWDASTPSKPNLYEIDVDGEYGTFVEGAAPQQVEW